MKKIVTLSCFLMLFACNKSANTTKVEINTTSSSASYNLEVAKTPEELQNGLMHRKSLDKNSGMLFLFSPVKPVAMWMKNTLIPLDMLFINPQNKIVCIKENATPLSEEFIVCDEEINAVIELNAGEVKNNNIKIGDSIKY